MTTGMGARRAFLATAAAVLGGLAACGGAEYCVAPNGVEGGKGTKESPWPIEKANASVVPGDTVILLGGTYHAWIQPAKSGAEGKPIVYKAAPGEIPLFTKVPRAIELSGRSYVTVIGISAKDTARWMEAEGGDHLTIEGCHFEMSKVPGSWESCRLKRMGDHLTFRKNSFKTGNDSLAIQGGSHHLVEDNSFDTAGHVCLVFMGVQRSVVRRNKFVNPIQKLMEVFTTRKREWEGEARKSLYLLIEENAYDRSTGQSGYSGIQFAGNKCILRRNVFRHCGQGMDFAGYGAPKKGKEENRDNPEAMFNRSNRFYNNVVFDCGPQNLKREGGSGLVFARDTKDYGDQVLINNIVYRNTSTPKEGCAASVQIVFTWDCVPSDARFFHNLIAADQPGKEVVYWLDAKYEKPPEKQAWTLKDYEKRYPELAANNLDADPQFADAEKGDFRLKPGSPCVDAGRPLTKAKAAGKGTEIEVEDAIYFCDGHKVVDGDTIRVGTESAKVTKVDYDANKLALDKSLSWEAGAPVSLDYRGKAPDMGAFEHDADAGTK